MATIPARPDAIVFDLDGTLVDSAPDLHSALNRTLAEFARGPLALAAVHGMIGDGATRLVERGFKATGGLPLPLAELAERFVAIYGEAVAERTRPYPGVPQALRRFAAAGAALGVCTNKPGALSRQLLAALGFGETFGCVAGGDDAPARKPDPRHLRHVLDALNAPPARAVMVGDSANDVAAARAAGVAVVLVSFGYSSVPARELGADAVVDSFAELEALFAA